MYICIQILRYTSLDGAVVAAAAAAAAAAGAGAAEELEVALAAGCAAEADEEEPALEVAAEGAAPFADSVAGVVVAVEAAEVEDFAALLVVLAFP